MSTKRSVLVTGATGQQGGAVARALVSRGHRVKALTRKPDSDAARQLVSAGADLVIGDLGDADSVLKAASGVGAMFLMGNSYEAGTEEEAVENLAAAREGLERAYEIDPENLDAAIYRDVLDCVLMFRDGRPAADIAIIADRLKKEVTSRALLQLGEQPRAWIGRRLKA